ncbi:MAG TPA: hypothetical protein VFQ39_10720 [Longimicrobium sp.]|nr:hypothetical protein [Longimicrobium sp.]
MVGELSFGYDAEKEEEEEDGKKKEGGDECPPALERFPETTVERTNHFFRALQPQGGWLDLTGTTRSAFALSGM